MVPLQPRLARSLLFGSRAQVDDNWLAAAALRIVVVVVVVVDCFRLGAIYPAGIEASLAQQCRIRAAPRVRWPNLLIGDAGELAGERRRSLARLPAQRVARVVVSRLR